jgi:uncharacterized HAD superfamily protein
MQKLCALDIDGVLNTYPDCWVEFINAQLGTSYGTLSEAKKILSYKTYKDLKHFYRTSGYKRNLPIMDDAVRLTKALRALEYKIVIVTSRPFDDYPGLKWDTEYWLDKNGFEYDDLLHSRYKHADIVLHYPEIEFMVEDNRSFANDISRFRFKVYLLNNKYNQGEISYGVQRVDSLDEIIQSLY